MKFPLYGYTSEVPVLPHHGAFAAERKFDVHTGIDLYAEPGSLVLAIEPGVVVGVEDFTGPRAGSPWWLDTMALLVSGPSGVVCYGEIVTNHGVGDRIHEGQILGEVRCVLRNDKGLPTSMLHFELYVPGTRHTVVWNLGEDRPSELLDPTELLKGLEHE